ncbi:MAG: sigma-70 family RNA polymerase sigma factor [Bacteroidales bacterium]|nr:sigma-70 family RNA polymerase sigma factor [Bacteroidales bacterium]
MATTYDTQPDIYSMSDQEVVQALLDRDKGITYNYLYKKCYPLFKSIYNDYYTDCENCIEFINEIYTLIMIPGKKSGKIPLANFSHKCTLTFWLKRVAINHCKRKYKRKPRFTVTSDLTREDSMRQFEGTEEIDLSSVNKEDVKKIIDQVKPERFRQIIIHRYLEEKTNEETALLLNMSRDNFYNKHLIAKSKVIGILKKEGLL